MSELKRRLEIAREINAKLATGKFKDTGEKYTPEKAQQDSSNPALRLTANEPKTARDCNWSK